MAKALVWSLGWCLFWGAVGCGVKTSPIPYVEAYPEERKPQALPVTESANEAKASPKQEP